MAHDDEPRGPVTQEELLSFYAGSASGRDLTGQATGAFQARLRAAHTTREGDCHFYHTLEFPDGSVVPGAWDFRGTERPYLGFVDFRDLSVLEFGPATGHLGFYMERKGAKVTIFDVGPGMVQDLLPLPEANLDEHRTSGTDFAARVRNSWWYAHAGHGSQAKAVYGDIYDLPRDMERHDVSVFCSILLHLSTPFAALRQAAAVTEKAMVVTETAPPALYGSPEHTLVEFNPGRDPGNLVNWWGLSPGAVVRMLEVLGFPHARVLYSECAFHKDHDPEAEMVRRFMFSVVAQREPGAIAFDGPDAAEQAESDRVRATIPIVGLEQMRAFAEARTMRDDMLASSSWRLTHPLRVVNKFLRRVAGR